MPELAMGQFALTQSTPPPTTQPTTEDITHVNPIHQSQKLENSNTAGLIILVHFLYWLYTVQCLFYTTHSVNTNQIGTSR